MLPYLSKKPIKVFSFTSIRSKLLFWFLILGMVPLLTGTVITWNQQVLSIKKESLDKLVAIRDLKVRQIDTWVNSRVADMKTLSCNSELLALEEIIFKPTKNQSDIKITQQIKQLLTRFVQNYNAYEELFIINPRTGTVEISTNRNAEQMDRSKNPYFTQPMHTRNLFIKDIYFSQFIGKNSMSFSMPIFCEKNNRQHIVGIMAARMDLRNSLYALLGDRTGLGKTGESLIINKDGMALSELRWHDNAPFNFKIQTEPARKATQGKTGVLESQDYRGEAVLTAYSHISQTKWGIVVKQDLAELHASIKTMMIHFIILMMGALVAIFTISFFTAKAIAAPIIEMAETAGKIRLGDLSARNCVVGSDELASLAKTFNTMATALASQLELRQINDEITQLLVDGKDLNPFRSNLLKELVSVTDSQMGAYFFLNKDADQYEPFTSIGITPDLLKSFDASTLEGELGRAVSEGKTTLLKNIPKDTMFQFRTFTGALLPKEIITIPVVINGIVLTIISLASITPYSKKALDIIKQPWLTGLPTALSNMWANAETARLAVELQTSNQELQVQAQELILQAQELQQTTEELQEQNQVLEIQREKVEEANQLKSEFLSNMSHELRTPLNSVMALSRVLLMQAKETLSAEELNYLEIIERNGKKLLSLINDILDLSKIEAGRMEVVSRQIQINETIEIIMERLKPLAMEKGILLHGDMAQNLPRITCDENRLHQILQNIMGNAVKFTHKGSVTVSAHRDKNNLQIKVSDTGIGIAPKELPHIFEEFRQVDGTSARCYEGTGLGLAIAYKTTKLLDGDLSVESTPGKGSIFTLTLPITGKIISEPAFPPHLPLISPVAPLPSSPHPPTTNNRERILVVEDNESAVIQVKKILEHAGYRVDIATSGQQALHYISDTIPDGIVLDLMMPGIDGFEVLERMRSTRTTACIPVLVLTARDLTPEDLNKLTANHIQQLVQKGDIDAQGLLAKIRTMLATLAEKSAEASVSSCLDQKHTDTQTQLRNVKAEANVSPGLDQESQPSEKTPRVMPSPPVEQEENRKKTPTVLIVEDNTDNMITIKAILGNHYTILEAMDGKQGLQLALTTLPDLILLDISLPEMDGYSVVKTLKQNGPTKHIPVIALTAHVMKGDKKRIMDAGCDDYIPKPVNPETLMSSIEKGINHAKDISH